jgi:hypothetical protein
MSISNIANRHYPDRLAYGEMPERYLKGKKYKDEDGDEFVLIDRFYGGLFKSDARLVQVDGTTYKGHIKTVNTRHAIYSVTEDGRWFNSSGMPVICPKDLDANAKLKEVQAESKKIEEDKKYKELKMKVLGKVKKHGE